MGYKAGCYNRSDFKRWQREEKMDAIKKWVLNVLYFLIILACILSTGLEFSHADDIDWGVHEYGSQLQLNENHPYYAQRRMLDRHDGVEVYYDGDKVIKYDNDNTEIKDQEKLKEVIDMLAGDIKRKIDAGEYQ